MKPIYHSKYYSQPETVDGIRFHSKKEAARYRELMTALRAGAIRNLRLQQEYLLGGGFTTPEGERVRAIKYLADFVYERKTEPDASGDVHWICVIEDVKGVRTREYGIKRKLMQERYGIHITEV